MMLPSYTVEEGEARLCKAIFFSVMPIILLIALYIVLTNPVLVSLPALSAIHLQFTFSI